MNVPFKVVSLENVDSQINPNLPLMFDTEENDLYDLPIQLAQFYQKDWDEVLLVQKPDVFTLKSILDAPDLTVVIQNACYDISVIQKQSETRWIPKNFECTLLLAKLHFYKEKDFKLDSILRYHLGYDPYKDLGITKKDMQKSNWDNPTYEQLLYGAIDVWHMPSLFDELEYLLTDENYKLDKLTARHCLDFQHNGMPVDQSRLWVKMKENELRREEVDCPINSKSYVQVRPFIGEEKSAAIDLAYYTLTGNKKAKLVWEDRKLRTLYSYLEKFKSEDGRIHGYFAPVTRGGRLSSSKQNLLQLPREHKDVFGFTPDDGKVLVYSDFSQIELRHLLGLTADPVLYDLYQNNKDVHTFVRDMLGIKDVEFAGIKVTGRQIAKPCNFLLLYYGGAKVLWEELVKEAGLLLDDVFDDPTDPNNLKNCRALRSGWRNLFPNVRDWQELGVKAWKRGIAWQTPLGRRYVGKMMTDQLNIQNQGGAADVFKLAMHRMLEQIKLDKTLASAKLLNPIHDSYIFECDDKPKVYKALSKIVAENMQGAWKSYSKLLKCKDIPMPVDVFVGLNWGEIEDNYKYKLEI